MLYIFVASYRSREDEVLAGVLANIREEEGNELSECELSGHRSGYYVPHDWLYFFSHVH